MNLLRWMFLLLLMLSPLGANGEILRAAHREAPDFNRAWNGGSQTRNAPFWQFAVDDPGSPGAKILRTDLSSPNTAPQEWGAAPQAEQHTQPIFAHNRVVAAIQTKGGWRVVSSDANSPAPQWLDMGEAPIQAVETLSINGQDELMIVGRNDDNAPAIWQGAFSGGGMGLSWQQHDPALASSPKEKAVMGEFDLGDSGRMLSLTWNPKQSSVQMQYRTSPAAGEPYSAWSQPVQSDATQLNKRGRFLQYRLTRSDGSLVSRDQFPPIEVAYSNGEDENGADKNKYDNAPGGVSGSGGGLNVDSSSDIDDMSGTDLGANASANSDSAASQSSSSSSSGGASSSKPGKSSPPAKSKTPNAAPKSNSDQKPTSQNKTPSPQKGSQTAQQQTPNENSNTNPANTSDTSVKNAQPGSEKEKNNKQDENSQRPEDNEENDNQENKEEKPESDNAAAPDEQQSNNGGGGNNQSMKSPGGGAGSGSGAAAGNGNSNADQGRQQEDSGDGANANGAEDQSPSGQNASPANAGDAPEDEGENTPAEEEDEPDPASAPPPPTMVPFANPGSIPLSSLLGSSMAPAQKEQAPKLDDARGGGDESTAPDGGLPTENTGDEPPKEIGDANGSDEEREADAGSPLGDRQQDDALSKRFGSVRPGFGGGGGGSGRSSSSSTNGRTARATDEIEYATAPAFANMKPRTGNPDTNNGTGWMWMLLVAALTAWLAYRVRNQRNRKREMEELQAQQAPRIVPQKLIDETHARQGAWEQVTHFVPDVQAVAIKNGTRYAVMSSGDVWKEPEQSNTAQSAPLKHVGRFAGEWLNAHLSVSDNALFFLGKNASGHLQGRVMPLRQINAKPLAFAPPKGLQDVQRAWFHKSRLWLQGDMNGEPAVYSAMADAAGVGGWVQETPNKFDAADSVCVSSGASMFFAGSPKQDREHLWLYTGENRTRGRLDWKPAAKTAYQGGEVFLFGDAKKCFMVEFDSQRPHLWFHVFGRGDEGEFLGRFTKEFDMPASARVFESHVSNGHLVLAGRDPETNRVVHLQAKVKTLLGVNQN
ncbi:MAG: hypothetical protein P9L94_07255 [Candidatus Hinthialibacter antarcticus]|nr:hypothetical protein [Candidatus Hinthialibacter antarcticus]